MRSFSERSRRSRRVATQNAVELPRGARGATRWCETDGQEPAIRPRPPSARGGSRPYERRSGARHARRTRTRSGSLLCLGALVFAAIGVTAGDVPWTSPALFLPGLRRSAPSWPLPERRAERRHRGRWTRDRLYVHSRRRSPVGRAGGVGAPGSARLRLRNRQRLRTDAQGPRRQERPGPAPSSTDVRVGARLSSRSGAGGCTVRAPRNVPRSRP